MTIAFGNLEIICMYKKLVFINNIVEKIKISFIFIIKHVCFCCFAVYYKICCVHMFSSILYFSIVLLMF